jgi:hypothetical protein
VAQAVKLNIIPKKIYMNEPIKWPSGEFTLPAAVALNRTVPEAEVRKALAAALAAKTIVQTRKGDKKVQGTFEVVKATGAAES